ncbi:hypothetical protein LNKW23_15750 [Paralimibaculum aggregatum]|uniref:HTH arsR-type domain-containing protein n=2 Tax=Paralimibaculum aggregatum TaxID=3036245 RepID=A0ABQ6LH76_9RHOB|nr:hypothetical protein LNKW23_15750 [Limibaculum sp. NKW23]
MDRASRHDLIFAALADPHRRAILAMLREAPRAVGELVGRLPLTQPGVTKHLGILERAGLIRRRAEGRRRICELSGQGFATLDDWLGSYRGVWEASLDRLAAMAEEETRHDDRDADRRADRDAPGDADRGHGEP